MNESGKAQIPYFLTKEYGDKQRKKRKILFMSFVVFCLAAFAIKEVWF